MRRVPHPTDGRTVLGEITDDGRELVARATKVLAAIRFGMEDLPDRECDRLTDTVTALTDRRRLRPGLTVRSIWCTLMSRYRERRSHGIDPRTKRRRAPVRPPLACRAVTEPVRDPHETALGIRVGLAAYLIWGLLVIFWKRLDQFNALELIGWRIASSAVVMTLVLTFTHRWSAMRTVLGDRRLLGLTVVAALLLTGNWGAYLYAVVHDHVLETALGYFMAPLGTMALGVLVLGERMTRLQRLAAGLAVVAVVILTVARRTPPDRRDHQHRRHVELLRVVQATYAAHRHRELRRRDVLPRHPGRDRGGDPRRRDGQRPGGGQRAAARARGADRPGDGDPPDPVRLRRAGCRSRCSARCSTSCRSSTSGSAG